MNDQDVVNKLLYYMPQFKIDFLTDLSSKTAYLTVARTNAILAFLSVLDEREQLLLKNPVLRDPFSYEVTKNIFGPVYPNNFIRFTKQFFHQPATIPATFKQNHYLFVPTYYKLLETVETRDSEPDLSVLVPHPHTQVDLHILRNETLLTEYMTLYQEQIDDSQMEEKGPLQLRDTPQSRLSFPVTDWTIRNIENYARAEYVSCTSCSNQVYPHEALQCSRFHIICDDCLHGSILKQISFLQNDIFSDIEPPLFNVQMTCPCSKNGPCSGTFLPGDLQTRLFEYELKLLEDPSILKLFTFDTLKSGCCPLCFFPLTRLYGQKHSFICKTCKQCYFWKRRG
ncbi:hypothetical protein BLNAU_8386 [Blattamonas nauphoetae]|uniref:Uncharacterized protein n=1 Tax=Blattamonas nauphoetae TaxID=2049346 RepID=A0ABQ9XYI9_9EUKA|nr:hypothetical protein BLNAU_8386 [Blattamonas nauphoetae]